MASPSSQQQQQQDSAASPDWSPFYCLPKAALTLSGLLQLDTSDNEVELLRRSQAVQIRYDNDINQPMGPCPRESHGKWKSRTEKVLSLIVTTHRIVLVDDGDNDNDKKSTTPTTKQSSTKSHRFIHLSNVHVIQSTGGPSFSSPFGSYKIILSTYTYGDIIFAFVTPKGSNGKEPRDTSSQQIQKALQRKLWEQQQRLQEKQTSQQTKTKRKVGVDHILTKHKLRHEHASKLADDALSGDAEQLLQEAGELLQVIQRYTVMLQKYNTPAEGSDDPDQQKLVGLLADMGMTSATAINTTINHPRNNRDKQEYYELTARQIADFLIPRFQKQSKESANAVPMMTLTDVYCLFNRARGTNLLSPEDVQQSCAVLHELNLGLSQRVFPDSGVIVVQYDRQLRMTENRIVGMCPTTPLEASHVLKLSPLLALEQLEEAERLGWVCRDVTLETIRFYPNKFLTETGWYGISKKQ
jgi:ESCRT-II complex subunit VPS36